MLGFGLLAEAISYWGILQIPVSMGTFNMDLF